MPTVWGLDLGEKRVGVARSDETGTIAEPVETIAYESRHDLLRKLKGCFENLPPGKVIVGLPKTLRGEEGPAAKKVLEFVEWLRPRLRGEWLLWDERLSTVEAERVLLEADLSRRKRRDVIDRLAAQRILQNYLDAQRHV